MNSSTCSPNNPRPGRGRLRLGPGGLGLQGPAAGRHHHGGPRCGGAGGGLEMWRCRHGDGGRNFGQKLLRCVYFMYLCIYFMYLFIVFIYCIKLICCCRWDSLLMNIHVLCGSAVVDSTFLLYFLLGDWYLQSLVSIINNPIRI